MVPVLIHRTQLDRILPRNMVKDGKPITRRDFMRSGALTKGLRVTIAGGHYSTNKRAPKDVNKLRKVD